MDSCHNRDSPALDAVWAHPVELAKRPEEISGARKPGELRNLRDFDPRVGGQQTRRLVHPGPRDMFADRRPGHLAKIAFEISSRDPGSGRDVEDVSIGFE